MTKDILTVMWKEWRDIPFIRGGWKGGIINILAFLGVIGVFMPAQFGRSFVSSAFPVFLALWGPMMFASSLSADTFAGERERHTLETLLATRLSDRAILLGKLATVVSYSWGMSVLILSLGLVSANFSHGGGRFLMYPAPVLLSALCFSFLLGLSVSSLGVIISLKAATVRQATQMLSLVFIFPVLLPILLPHLPKGFMESALHWYSRTGPINAIMTFAIGILVVDIYLLRLAFVKFRRSGLILD